VYIDRIISMHLTGQYNWTIFLWHSFSLSCCFVNLLQT